MRPTLVGARYLPANFTGPCARGNELSAMAKIWFWPSVPAAKLAPLDGNYQLTMLSAAGSSYQVLLPRAAHPRHDGMNQSAPMSASQDGGNVVSKEAAMNGDVSRISSAQPASIRWLTFLAVTSAGSLTK